MYQYKKSFVSAHLAPLECWTTGAMQRTSRSSQLMERLMSLSPFLRLKMWWLLKFLHPSLTDFAICKLPRRRGAWPCGAALHGSAGILLADYRQLQRRIRILKHIADMLCSPALSFVEWRIDRTILLVVDMALEAEVTRIRWRTQWIRHGPTVAFSIRWIQLGLS